MRALLTLTASAIMLCTPLFAQSDAAAAPATKQEVVFTADMNKAAIDQLKKDMRAQGILLMCDDLKFGPEGQLQRIAFTVQDASGVEQKASRDDISIPGVFGFVIEDVNGKKMVTRIGEIRPAPAKAKEEDKSKKKKKKED